MKNMMRTRTSSLSVLKRENESKIWTLNSRNNCIKAQTRSATITTTKHFFDNCYYKNNTHSFHQIKTLTQQQHISLSWGNRYQSSVAESCPIDEQVEDYEESIEIAITNTKNSHPSQLHCSTCTCESRENIVEEKEVHKSHCGLKSLVEVEKDDDFLPEPLPEPVYSFYKRVLPKSLIALNSEEGRNMLLSCKNLKIYFALAEQFMNQSDPAYCGVTTLAMMLNVYKQDPNSLRWKGGWRFYADEQSVLSHCTCYLNHPHYIQRKGITMEEFQTLAQCHKIPLQSYYASTNSYEEFHSHIRQIFSRDSNVEDMYVVVSFARSTLEQTGDGHFSPLAAYHEPTNQVLLLDVARFKYTPYWVPLPTLYNAMMELDSVTQKSRGWFLFSTPTQQQEPEAKKLALDLPLMEDIKEQNQQKLLLMQQNKSSTQLPITTPSCPEKN